MIFAEGAWRVDKTDNSAKSEIFSNLQWCVLEKLQLLIAGRTFGLFLPNLHILVTTTRCPYVLIFVNPRSPVSPVVSAAPVRSEIKIKIIVKEKCATCVLIFTTFEKFFFYVWLSFPTPFFF